MEVQAQDIKVRLLQRHLDCALGISSFNRKAEFRIQDSRRCETVGVRVNARR